MPPSPLSLSLSLPPPSPKLHSARALPFNGASTDGCASGGASFVHPHSDARWVKCCGYKVVCLEAVLGQSSKSMASHPASQPRRHPWGPLRCLPQGKEAKEEERGRRRTQTHPMHARWAGKIQRAEAPEPRAGSPKGEEADQINAGRSACVRAQEDVWISRATHKKRERRENVWLRETVVVASSLDDNNHRNRV